MITKRTKIIATLGPATDTREQLVALVRAGVDVVRLNFSHGSVDEHRQRVERVRQAAAEVGRAVAILIDLQGPKIRVENFVDGGVELQAGAVFALDPQHPSEQGDASLVGVSYAALADDVKPDDVLLLNDGAIELRVQEVVGGRVVCQVVQGGWLSSRKGLNVRGGGLSAPALSDKDRNDIKHAADLQADYLAVSFIRDADDVVTARQLMRDAGGHARIVAKIERHEAVEGIEAIANEADAVMVARGDLGVEIGYARLTGLQKRIIQVAEQARCVSITATQMMESMIDHAIPTRAEVADVANAVLDGTDAVMLSAETAVGNYPVEVVKTMAEVCVGAEAAPPEVTERRLSNRPFDTIDQAIAAAVAAVGEGLKVSGIVAMTESGSTALWLSRNRLMIPIFAVTPSASSCRRLALFRGVYPILLEHGDQPEAVAMLKERGLVQSGEVLILTRGDQMGVVGSTNTLRIIQVD